MAPMFTVGQVFVASLTCIPKKLAAIGAPTESAAFALVEFTAAVIVVVPALAPVASPPPATPAIAGQEEFHWATAVRSWVVPLLYVPVAVNCCMEPMGIRYPFGVTVIDS